MNLPRILVTGATGRTGGADVAELVQRGWPVRAVVRSRDARGAALDAMGVETVVADMFDSEQLLDAMRGIQRVYFLPLFDRFMIQSAVAFPVAPTPSLSIDDERWRAEHVAPGAPSTAAALAA